MYENVTHGEKKYRWMFQGKYNVQSYQQQHQQVTSWTIKKKSSMTSSWGVLWFFWTKDIAQNDYPVTMQQYCKQNTVKQTHKAPIAECKVVVGMVGKLLISKPASAERPHHSMDRKRKRKKERRKRTKKRTIILFIYKLKGEKNCIS